MSPPVPLRVLLLEDQPADAELTLIELRRSGLKVAATRVDTEAGFVAALDDQYDAILADYSLPQFDAGRAVQLVRARGLDLPFIVVSGTIGEERAAAIIKDGANDYVLKDRLSRLGLAVRQALAQHAMRREKEQAELRFRALVEHAADIMTIVDAAGKIRYASPALFRVLGVPPAAANDATMLDLLHPDDVGRAEQVFLTALAEPGATANGEFRLRHQNGEWRWLEAIATNFVSPTDPFSGVIFTLRDITERRRLEEVRALAAERAAQLASERDYARRLEELATLRADFTAMVAHELGSRIAAIRRSAELVALDPLSPLQDEALAAIQSEVASLQILIADARVAATVDRDDFTVLPRPVPVDALVDEATSFARTLPGQHPLVVDASADRQVLADPARIGQVLRNLLSNAAKYSPPGSPVTLRALDRSDCVRFEVADQGYGIEPTDLSLIFAKYGRGRDAAVRNIPGVGLGLYLSRRITHAHGSDLTVDSSSGAGAIFGFELKVVP